MNLKAFFNLILPTNYLKKVLNIKYLRQQCTIGRNVQIKNSKSEKKVNLAHSVSCNHSIIGAYSSVGRYTKVSHSKIGKFCSISWDCTLGALIHPLDRLTTHAFPYVPYLVNIKNQYPHEQLQIGNDVWIGANSVILSGVQIGDGVVIEAGAVVTKNLPAYCIAGCISARINKYHCSEDLIQKLLDIKWWNFDEKVIIKQLDLFQHKIDEHIIMKLLELKGKHANSSGF